MNASMTASSAVSAFLLPSFSLILICAIGLILRRPWPRLGLTLSWGALIVLTALSTEAGALLFVTPLENWTAPLVSTRDTGAQAIVVLGGGRLANAPEYG